MNLRETRKKIQRSIEFLANHERPDLALAELEKIQATVEAEIGRLRGTPAMAGTEPDSEVQP